MAFSTGVGSLTLSAVKTELGTTAIVLLWVSFATISIVALGMWVMILSVALFDSLTDDAVYRGPTAADGNTTETPNIHWEPPSAPIRHLNWDDGDE